MHIFDVFAGVYLFVGKLLSLFGWVSPCYTILFYFARKNDSYTTNYSPNAKKEMQKKKKKSTNVHNESKYSMHINGSSKKKKKSKMEQISSSNAAEPFYDLNGLQENEVENPPPIFFYFFLFCHGILLSF